MAAFEEVADVRSMKQGVSGVDTGGSSQGVSGVDTGPNFDYV